MRALAIAATGMSAQQLNVEVIANNIANINTTSYKRSRAEFTDLFYQVDRMQGVPNRAGEAAVPEGAKLGLGVRSVAPTISQSMAEVGSRSRDQMVKRSIPVPDPSIPTRTASWSRQTAIPSIP